MINSILGEICRIKKSLLDLEEYRFYSSSILIIYEGLIEDEKRESYNFSDAENSTDCDIFEMEAAEPTNFDVAKYRKKELSGCTVKMKMIDFANASFPSMDLDQSMHEGPDRGFLMGLDNLYEILESLLEEDVFK